MLTALGSEDATAEARRRMLTRDIDQLNLLGYDVRNVADVGTDGVYVMRARDNRLQVSLTPEQRGELLRAALAAGLEGLGAHLGDDPSAARPSAPTAPHLDLVQRATTRHCRVRFTYPSQPRLVHPAQVHSGPSGWYLRGREEGGDILKELVVSRMSDVSLDHPGTAEVLDEVARPTMDPLSWREDPPTEVVSRGRARAPGAGGEPARVTGVLVGRLGVGSFMTYVVTNRAVFRWRVYELGTRVRVVSPDDVRAEILDELRAMVEAS